MTSRSVLDASLSDLRYEWIDAQESADVAAFLAADIGAHFGPRDERPLSILVRRNDGALIGGINGCTHWQWLYLRHFWVAAPHRGCGLGRALMSQLEDLAVSRGAIGIYLDTFDESAAQFYERLGFSRHGQIDDFPPGHQRIFMCKKMTD